MSIVGRKISMVKPLGWAVICLLTVYFVRLAVVGIFEIGDSNDSGWYYSVAQLVAEEGVYGTRLNTIANDDLVATSIHNRPAVQSPEEYELFPSGVTVGPAFILPQALVFKLIGVGQLSRTVFPLLAFIVLVLLCSMLIKEISSTKGVLVFALLLILVPRLSVPLAIQAYAEPMGMAYLVGGLSLLYFAMKRYGNLINNRILLLVGLLLGLSILTKTIYFIGVVVIWLTIASWLDKANKRQYFKQMVSVSTGILVPLFLFEAYRFLTLFQLAGIEAWKVNIQATISVFINFGSGVYRASFLPSFGEVMMKLSSFVSVGIVVVVLVPSLLMLKRVVVGSDSRVKKLIVTLGALFGAYCMWFLFFNTTGWFRHLWPGAFFLIVIGSALAGKLPRTIFVVGVIFIVATSFVLNGESTWNINSLVLGYQEGFRKNGVVQVSMPIIPYKEQVGMVDAISKLPKGASLYYERNIFVGELLSIGRKMQPIARASSFPAYLVMGSAQQGSYALVPAEDLAAVKTNLCSEVIYDSMYYALCRVDSFSESLE